MIHQTTFSRLKSMDMFLNRPVGHPIRDPTGYSLSVCDFSLHSEMAKKALLANGWNDLNIHFEVVAKKEAMTAPSKGAFVPSGFLLDVLGTSASCKNVSSGGRNQKCNHTVAIEEGIKAFPTQGPITS